ncbi:MmgE/PrpD family protein [Achromobacter aloeverae]|uniref:2-methylcitrate dehydratase n=1 Tax=Achromobacter aloeverae TaxID=1750518 RepID=A0A4Q1HM70_9BURK|nr:MmgE/PrpD family protein [Achromobacter aloeverae]RXN91468.1 2-methylcitrate dehydratase [Achromobacter aloeverae]
MTPDSHAPAAAHPAPIAHHVRVYKSADTPPRQELLAWKLAEAALDDAPLDDDVATMIVNRVIDNTGVAVAGLLRRPVANARAQARAHGHAGGATVYGLPSSVRVHCEWAAWANGTAVRELDFHDTFLSADMNHPGDMIPSIVAVGQQCGASGADLMRGIAAAYEISGSLTKGIALHTHRVDHLLHIAAGMVAGIGAMLRLPTPILYQAINHAVHVTLTTRQSRKGEISTWKANAPAHAGKLAVEAVDRAMRGETSPAPIYEGDDSILAWILDGPEAAYTVHLPARGASKRAIMETYTKAYSAEIQSQAWIDLAFRLRPRIADLAEIAKVEIITSHHTHRIIGSGSGDPQKYNPGATRETLDHSLMYIFTVALQDGRWHHIDSYAPERARRADTVALWRKVGTVEDAEWDRRYHHPDPNRRAFGGRVVITLHDGRVIEDEIEVADAHPRGARPFVRENYIEKFRALAGLHATAAEQDRFLDAVLALPGLPPGALAALNVEVPGDLLADAGLMPGLFERQG